MTSENLEFDLTKISSYGFCFYDKLKNRQQMALPFPDFIDALRYLMFHIRTDENSSYSIYPNHYRFQLPYFVYPKTIESVEVDTLIPVQTPILFELTEIKDFKTGECKTIEEVLDLYLEAFNNLLEDSFLL